MPTVFANDHRCVVLFFTSSASGTELGWAVFNGVAFSSLGFPNDEALSGHSLYGAGLTAYGAFRVHSSELIDTLEIRNRVHSQHRPEMFTALEHVIVTFHDKTFDCVCREWSAGTIDSGVEASRKALAALETGVFPS